MPPKPKAGASKSAEKRARKAAEALEAARKLFARHYAGEEGGFGDRMTTSLLPALERQPEVCALLNPWADPASLTSYLLANAPLQRVPGVPLPAVLRVDPSAPKFSPGGADALGVLQAYHLDPASLLPVIALEPEPHSAVLDMCAAPGGKSFAIAQHLGPRGRLVANELASDRLARLRKTLQLYVPSSASALGGAPPAAAGGGGAAAAAAGGGASGAAAGSTDPAAAVAALLPVPLSGAHTPQVETCSHDGTVYTGWAGSFDRVLLDAPCSTERHVLLGKGEELLAWGPGRNKANATRQTALLCTALDAVRPGGTVVYSTCSLSRRENDGVVAKALERMGGVARVVPLRFVFGEPTPLGGWHVLPDTASGCGPIYLCKLVREAGEDGAGAGRRAPARVAVRGDYTAVGPQVPFPVRAAPAAAPAATAAPGGRTTGGGAARRPPAASSSTSSSSSSDSEGEDAKGVSGCAPTAEGAAEPGAEE